MKSNDRPLIAMSLMVLSFFCSLTAIAQGTRSLSSTGRRLDEFNKVTDKATRDELNREMGVRKPSAEEIRKAAAVKVEIKEDFESIQSEYNKFVTSLTSKEQLRPVSVRESAERIHKHAVRLRVNVVFPKTEQPEAEDIKNNLTVGDTRKQLRSLCEQIYLFVTNPLFENPNILDIEAARKAAKTLETIIDSSGRLKEIPD
jgi:hypothetical protein